MYTKDDRQFALHTSPFESLAVLKCKKNSGPLQQFSCMSLLPSMSGFSCGYDPSEAEVNHGWHQQGINESPKFHSDHARTKIHLEKTS